MRTVPDVCPHYPRGVPDGHQCSAEIVLVGEAPGEREDEEGLPFVGPAGWIGEKVWDECGIRRKDVYITNVLNHRPTEFSNDIKLVGRRELGAASEALVIRLHNRFRDNRPIVVVPTGGTALYALTGRTGIQKWRGSIIEADMLWEGQKCIPTLHPAYLLRTPGLAKTMILDWKRIKGDTKFRDLRHPTPTHIIYPTNDEKREFYELCKADPSRPVTVDIETGRGEGHPILCVGFGYSSDLSCTLLASDFTWIKRLCELPNPKVLQNGFFDYWHLHRWGINLVNYIFDISAMFHCLDPNAGPTSKGGKGSTDDAERSRIKCYSLAYMGSILTRVPYWKDMCKGTGDKEESEGTKVMESEEWWKLFMEYNGIDCTSTYEIFERLYERLQRAGKLDLYFTLYANLFPPLLGLMLRGVRVDVAEAEREHTRLTGESRQARDDAETIAGRPLHAISRTADWFECNKCRSKATGKAIRHKGPLCPKGGTVTKVPGRVTEGDSISAEKVKEYLYGPKREGGLGIPARRKKGRVTTDEAALRGLRLAYPQLAGEVVGKILEFRRKEKLASFLAGGIIDADGRIRSQYKLLVQTGRLSSASNPSGSGANLQNTDAEAMHLLKPDRGKVFLRADLSQAEDRVVKVLTGVPALVTEAQSRPELLDVHTRFAAKLFTVLLGHTVSEKEVTKEQRYMGKRGKHARNYGMTERKMAEIIAKDGPKVGITRVVTVEECAAILEAIDAITPEIATHYQRPIRDVIRTIGVLTNSWGASIDFGTEYRFSMRDDQRQDIFRKGYAWIPQGEVGRLMNQWGLVPVQRWINEQRIDAAINLQRHDELVLSVYIEDLWDVSQFIVGSLERPRIYSIGTGYPKTELVIPVEMAFGIDGGKKGILEMKKLPETRDEFDEKINKWYMEVTK